MDNPLPTVEDVRQVDRDPLALAMFAAWVNLPVDKLPDAMRGHTCPATMAAWKRVGEAATAHLSSALEKRIGEAVAAEREVCAALAESLAGDWDYTGENIAKAIRARTLLDPIEGSGR